jgi:hypothetical protein
VRSGEDIFQAPSLEAALTYRPSRPERLAEGPYLELQARRTRKGWTSWGDELEWTGAAREARAEGAVA